LHKLSSTLEYSIHLKSSYCVIKKCVNQVTNLVIAQSFNSLHQIINKGHLILMQHDKIPHSLKDFPTCQLHIDVWKLRCYVIDIFVTRTMIHAIHIIFTKNEPIIQAWRNACCSMTTTKTMKSIVIEQNNAQRISATSEWSSTQKKINNNGT
jgi:hypothetical protein